MAGLIAALFGGKSSTPHTDVETGVGGYQAGPGPTGQYGFPGSTALTRTNQSLSPRGAQVRSDTNYGFEQALSTRDQTRQASPRGDNARDYTNPRLTPKVRTPQPLLTAVMQETPATNLGGQLDKTQAGARTIGGNPMRESAREGGHDQHPSAARRAGNAYRRDEVG